MHRKRGAHAGVRGEIERAFALLVVAIAVGAAHDQGRHDRAAWVRSAAIISAVKSLPNEMGYAGSVVRAT